MKMAGRLRRPAGGHNDTSVRSCHRVRGSFYPRARPRPIDRRRTARPRHDRKARQAVPDFPLHAHATGRWAKKVRGRRHYFGPWADPDGALAKYLAEKADRHAGRTPRATTEIQAN